MLLGTSTRPRAVFFLLRFQVLEREPCVSFGGRTLRCVDPMRLASCEIDLVCDVRPSSAAVAVAVSAGVGVVAIVVGSICDLRAQGSDLVDNRTSAGFRARALNLGPRKRFAACFRRREGV